MSECCSVNRFVNIARLYSHVAKYGLVFLLFLKVVFFFPKSEILIPNNTIEYANYLHIKSTPRKTKSMAQTLYKSTGLGSEGPKPHFCQLDFLALKGARGQAYNGDDTEMIYPKSMQIKFFG